MTVSIRKSGKEATEKKGCVIICLRKTSTMTSSRVQLTLLRRSNKNLSMSSSRQPSQESSLEFKTDTKDYSVPEFYAKFEESLPLVVMVKQGYFGDIFSCKFNRYQILYINAVSQQKRILARFMSPSGPKLLSIPDTFTEKFCIFEDSKDASGRCPDISDKDNEEQYLYSMLATRDLPFRVRFPRGRTLQTSRRKIKTDSIPPFCLTQTFDEICILGNFVSKARLVTSGANFQVCAEMNPDVLQIPLYLSQLRVSLVTGILNQPDVVWGSFQQELKRLSAQIEYDMQSGNISIAEYSTDSFQPRTTYTYIQPKAYVDVSSLMLPQTPENYDTTKPSSDYKDKHSSEADTDVYEELDETAIRTSKNVDGVENKNIINTPQDSIDNSLSGYEVLSASTRPSLSSSTVKPTKELGIERKSKAEILNENPGSIVMAELQSSLARRNLTQSGESIGNAGLSTSTYINNIPRSTVLPSVLKERAGPSKIFTEKAEESSSKTEMSEAMALTDINSADDVAKLSIRDVGEFLERLNLKQYVNVFKEQLVDGELLLELDREVLQKEFGMSGIEAIRLHKFARDGHLPS